MHDESFAIELRGEIIEVGLGKLSASGPQLSEAIIKQGDVTVHIEGMFTDAARILGRNLYRHVRITIEPVED